MKPSSKRTPWLFLLPSLVCVSCFVLIPFLDAVRRSFFSAMGGEFVGMRNYQSIFQNEAFRVAAWNTLRFTVICIPALVLLSLLLAVLVGACKGFGETFKTVFLFPMAAPVASMVMLWRVLFHENGLLNAVLSQMGAAPVDWMRSGYAFSILVGSYLWKNAGYDMVLWASGLSGINVSLYEAARVDGANAWQQLRWVTLPALRPTVFTVSVLSLLNSFKVFREAYLVAGDYPDPSIYMLQHLFNNWFLMLDVDKMCAAAVLLAVVVLAVIGVFSRVFSAKT